MSVGMADENVKLTFRESMGLLRFGFKLAGGISPMYYPVMLLRSFTNAVQPLAALYFSARILNELTGSRDVRTIVTLASSTVLLTFILSAAKAFLSREYSAIADFERIYYKILSLEAERYIQMDFS